MNVILTGLSWANAWTVGLRARVIAEDGTRSVRRACVVTWPHLHVKSCCEDRCNGATEAVTRQKQRQLRTGFLVAPNSLQQVDQLIEQAHRAAFGPVEERCIEPIMHTCRSVSHEGGKVS